LDAKKLGYFKASAGFHYRAFQVALLYPAYGPEAPVKDSLSQCNQPKTDNRSSFANASKLIISRRWICESRLDWML